jgi:glycosyltransferase involved in cell wall biosynthesis
MRGDADVFGVAGIAGKLSSGRYDVVHMHTSRAHMLGCLAARMSGRTRTIVSRRVDYSSRQKGTPFSGLKYRFGVDRYIAISEAVQRVLIAEGVHPRRVRIVHSGIDPDRLALRGTDVRAEFGIPPDAALVGVVAHFADHKGHRYLVEAMPRLLEAVPDTRVLFAGKGELRADLEEQAKRLGVDDRVIFAGFRSDVPDCFMAMDVVAAPSVLEGLNTSILDALYLERTVVASGVGGIPEIVHDGQTGVLVPPRNPERLADAIARVLRDREEAKRLGRNGRALVLEGFTSDAMVDGTLAVYEEVVGRGRERVA